MQSLSIAQTRSSSNFCTLKSRPFHQVLLVLALQTPFVLNILTKEGSKIVQVQLATVEEIMAQVIFPALTQRSLILFHLSAPLSPNSLC
jgi:hypothetical protein